jgi:hypothetical protein
MKNYILLLSSLLVLGLTSCKHKEKAKQAPANPEPKTEVVNCAVTVSFGSPGTGIDGKKYDEIKKMIEDKKLKYTEKQQGREGERKLCLPLTELNANEKGTFIDQLKKTAATGQLVSVSES